MGYGKLGKGISEEEAKRKLQDIMPSSKPSDHFQGASPPSIFVGSHSYPKVNTGILSPQHPGDSGLMDSPDEWYANDFSIEKVAMMRTSLVNSRKKVDVEQTDGFVTNTREIAMARKPVDLEVSLEKSYSGVTGGRVKPVSSSGDVEELILGENPSVERKIEDMFYDTDARTETAVRELSQKDIDVYSIQQSLSAGMLGEEENRKIVPTRWSITATDDMVSKNLRSGVKQYQELGQIEYYTNEYLGNQFHIFLIPGRWEYELMEMKRPGSVWNAAENTYIAHNYEPFSGRTSYAEQTAGAYYAARLGALEHLNSRRRQAKVLILRNVSRDYWAPLGVWIIRETVRNAFSNGKELDTFRDLKMNVGNEFKFLYRRIENRSKIIGGRQSSLSDF
jgi:hypothetical protein